MSIQIIGVGFGRTGTKSLQIALEQLGYAPCYHGTEVFAHPEHIPAWQAALDGKAVDWGDLLQGYGAIVDWPGCLFYTQLLTAFPDAKVILTLRDAAQWYASATNTIYQTRLAYPPELLALVPERQAAVALFEQVIWQRTFGGRFAEQAHALAIFNQHNAQVQQQTPVERLLIYTVAEGWAPLCQFLNVPVPMGLPFPRHNEAAAFQAMVAQDRQRLLERHR